MLKQTVVLVLAATFLTARGGLHAARAIRGVGQPRSAGARAGANRGLAKWACVILGGTGRGAPGVSPGIGVRVTAALRRIPAIPGLTPGAQHVRRLPGSCNSI
jgi:hypothetical protein